MKKHILGPRNLFGVALITIQLILMIFLMPGCNSQTNTTFSNLADTSWNLFQYGQPYQLTTVQSTAKISLNFRGTGGYDGSTGPNNYGGQCRIAGNQISINALTETTNQDALGAFYFDLLR